MSNKLVKLTDEQRKQQEDEKYLQETPSRMEVANYCNSLIEKHVLPEMVKNDAVIQQTMTLGFMVLQSVLIDKGIITIKELENITKEFVERQKKEQESQSEESVESN